MPNFYEIPCAGTPETFSIDLGGTTYNLTLVYRNADEAGWALDIADASKTPIVSGIPLVTGCDLLAQYKHLGFAGRMWVQTIDDPDVVPTFDNLGSGCKLFWVSD